MTRFRFALALLAMGLMAAIGRAKVPESASNRNPYPAGKGPVKVFILAGQSNMEGQGSLRNLEYLVYNEKTAPDYEHLKDKDGRWVQRQDVWVWTTNGERAGNLKPGFGVSESKVGPELAFGWVVGEAMDNQVLLIKTCWGGKSVRRDFLSPRSAMPADDLLQKELERRRQKEPNATLDDVKATYGLYYRKSIEHVKDVLGRLKELFPGYKEDTGYELAGLVWFQGWNDMVDGDQRGQKYVHYTERLANFVRDVRQEFKTPNLPVVIGELGAGGPEKRGDFQAAQKAVAEIPEFKGTVVFVETAQFWDPDVEKMVNENVWKGPDWTRFYNVGSDRGYHYLGSGRIYYQMGKAFGEAMMGRLAPK